MSVYEIIQCDSGKTLGNLYDSISTAKDYIQDNFNVYDFEVKDWGLLLSKWIASWNHRTESFKLKK